MSGELTQAITKVPVLTGHADYCAWSIEVKSTAYLASLWKAIQGTNVALSSSDTDKAALDTRLERAIGLITKTVSPTLKVELFSLETAVPAITSTSNLITTTTPATTRSATASEMWVHLQKKFEKVDGISALLDFQAINHAKLVDDGTLDVQLDAFQDLRSRCALHGFIYDDWQFAALILIALPKSYHHVKESFLTTSTPQKLMAAEVCSRILDTERRRKAEATPTANILSTKPNAPVKGGKSKGKNKRSKRPPDDRPCHACGKAGHWACECRAKKDNKPSNAGPANKLGSSSLNVVEEVSDAESDSPFFT